MNVEVSTLRNGLRVVTDDMPHLETTAVGVWVGVGARAERPEVNGISHMLEHMAFKGTERRTARQIAEEIERVGGQLNAYTSREQTAYYARVLKDDLALAVDILADILQNSVFDEAELGREREVIIQEIGEANDTPDDIVFDHLQAAAFRDQPMGRSILGTVEHVRSFDRTALSSYMAEHYRAPGMVLAAAGRVDHAQLVALAEDAFAGLADGPCQPCDAARYVGGEENEPRELEQIHLTLGFNGVAFDDPDYYAFQVFTTVLGGGMSSRLFQEVRERRGLAYSVYAFSSSYTDSGLFGVYAGTGPEQIGELIPVISGEMAGMLDDVDDAEVARARAQLKAGLMMSLESSTARAEQIARQLLVFGRVIPIDELVGHVDAVDVAAVRRVGERIIAAGPPTVAAVGPIGALEPYERIAGRFH